ncbi:MAG: hypothetical protein JXA14_12075 [Anaerolineae bacterium]|nr:hypothetical protein [Anaerolineae bacterium]
MNPYAAVAQSIERKVLSAAIAEGGFAKNAIVVPCHRTPEGKSSK